MKRWHAVRPQASAAWVRRAPHNCKVLRLRLVLGFLGLGLSLSRNFLLPRKLDDLRTNSRVPGCKAFYES